MPENSLKVPRNVPTTCFTAKPMLECTGSDCQVPVGMVDSAWAVVIECLLRESYDFFNPSKSLAEKIVPTTIERASPSLYGGVQQSSGGARRPHPRAQSRPGRQPW